MEEVDIVRAVILHEGQVLVLQNEAGRDDRDGSGQPTDGRWELPGGFVKEDESREEAVRREVREETGLDLAVVERLERVIVERDGRRADCQYFLMRSDEKDIRLQEGHAEYRWVEPGAFKGMDWYNYAGYSIPVLEGLGDRDD